MDLDVADSLMTLIVSACEGICSDNSAVFMDEDGDCFIWYKSSELFKKYELEHDLLSPGVLKHDIAAKIDMDDFYLSSFIERWHLLVIDDVIVCSPQNRNFLMQGISVTSIIKFIQSSELLNTKVQEVLEKDKVGEDAKLDSSLSSLFSSFRKSRETREAIKYRDLILKEIVKLRKEQPSALDNQGDTVPVYAVFKWLQISAKFEDTLYDDYLYLADDCEKLKNAYNFEISRGTDTTKLRIFEESSVDKILNLVEEMCTEQSYEKINEMREILPSAKGQWSLIQQSVGMLQSAFCGDNENDSVEDMVQPTRVNSFY